jgi:hypothetical protein
MPAGSGRYPSGQRGQTVNLLAYAFGGSNPPLPTIVANGLSTARAAGGLFQNGVAAIVANGVCTARTEGGLSEMGVASTRPVNRRGLRSADSACCGNSSAVERQPSKLGVAGSNPVSRSIATTGLSSRRAVGGPFETRSDRSIHSAHVAQLAEHALGKGEVSGSIPDMGSRYVSPTKRGTHGR